MIVNRLFSAITAGVIPVLFSVSATAATLQQAYIKASNTGDDDRFGHSVAVSGDTMVIGAVLEDSDASAVDGDQTNNLLDGAGAAYVFVRSGTNWIQQAYLKASNADAGDQFGGSVAISGDTIVVGACGEKSAVTGVNGNQSDDSAYFAGAAYVFVRTGTNWVEQAYLKASNTDPDDLFGNAVAIERDTIVIGACGESSDARGVDGDQSNNRALNAGAVYVFVRAETNWTQQAYLKASNTGLPNDFGANDAFGNSVAISGDTIVVGAYHEDSSAPGVNGDQGDNSAVDAGAAYVFVRNGTNWTQQAYLKASNPGSGFPFGDEFGWAVSIDGDTAVVGSRYEDSAATGVNGHEVDNGAFLNSGAAYVFLRDGTNWTQQAYLKASNTGADDYFGWAVAVADDAVVVGAVGEDSNARGTNGGHEDNSSSWAGAVYTFTRRGTTWTPQAYLKAPNSDSDDQFGFSVAVHAGTVIAGACFEDSDATGMNGDQSNNNSFWSGAVYVFADLRMEPRLIISSSAGGSYLIQFNGVTSDGWQLQRATNIAGPWTTNLAMNEAAAGILEFHDTNAPSGQAFYRVVQQ